MTNRKTINNTAATHNPFTRNRLVFRPSLKTVSGLAVGGLLGAAALLPAACTQGTTAGNGNQSSSYTAARHSSLGSHIPQPDSADTSSATASTGLQQQQTEQLSQYGNVASQSAPAGGGR